MGPIPGTCKCQNLYQVIFFSPWIWIKTTRKIIRAVSHWKSRANACKHLLWQCVYRTKYHCVTFWLHFSTVHPTRQLRVKCHMMKNSSVQRKKTALFFSLYFVLSHSHWETFTPLLSAGVLTAKGSRGFLFIFFYKNIIFILWDTLSQVKLNLIQIWNIVVLVKMIL